MRGKQSAGLEDREYILLLTGTLSKFDDDFFSHLNKESKHDWDASAREGLELAIINFLRRTIGSCTARSLADQKDAARLSARSAELKTLLETWPTEDRGLLAIAFSSAYSDDEHNVDNAAFDKFLSALSILEELGSSGESNNKFWVDVLILDIAKLYRGIGGAVSISPDGPLARVLMAVHECLPAVRGLPKSPEAFVRRTSKIRPELRRMVGTYIGLRQAVEAGERKFMWLVP